MDDRERDEPSGAMIGLAAGRLAPPMATEPSNPAARYDGLGSCGLIMIWSWHSGRTMRRFGTSIAIAAVFLGLFWPQPAAALWLRIGPFHFGVPFFGHRLWRHHAYLGRNSAELAPARSTPAV